MLANVQEKNNTCMYVTQSSAPIYYPCGEWNKWFEKYEKPIIYRPIKFRTGKRVKVENPILSDAISQHFFANLSPFLFHGESISLFGWLEREVEGKVSKAPFLYFCPSLFATTTASLPRERNGQGGGFNSFICRKISCIFMCETKVSTGNFEMFCRQSRHRRIPCQRLFQDPPPPLLEPKRRTWQADGKTSKAKEEEEEWEKGALTL